MLNIKKGNIFTTNCSTIVNTVNCVGVMGAGIAYEFRLRHPDMFEKYKKLCNDKLIQIGKLWIYKPENGKWVLNFPTKFHWKYPSKIEYLEKGLEKFVDTHKCKGITSIAFPILGAENGGIPENQSIEIMRKYLEPLDIEIEIYYYDKYVQDDLYIEFTKLFNSIDERELATKSGLRIDFVRKVKNALDEKEINSLSSLLRVKGIGEVTLEKSFRFIMDNKSNKETPKLF